MTSVFFLSLKFTFSPSKLGCCEMFTFAAVICHYALVNMWLNAQHGWILFVIHYIALLLFSFLIDAFRIVSLRETNLLWQKMRHLSHYWQHFN